MKHIKTLKIITTTLFAGALFALSSAHAATPTYVSGVPIATFCASYAKNEQTKFVAITVVLKIKEQPAKKAIYMRQYQTFLALGKQYCKGYVTTAPAAPAPAPVVTPPPSDGYFTGFDGTLLAGLSNGDRAVISGRIEQGKQSFTSIVQDLINKGRLVESDKQEMQ